MLKQEDSYLVLQLHWLLGRNLFPLENPRNCQDECRRLRQSIKCGLVKRFIVGEIQEKALALQSVRLNDASNLWLETETLRLNHLRDRASENGRKREYPLLSL